MMSWTKVLMEALGMFMSLRISSSLFLLSPLMCMCGKVVRADKQIFLVLNRSSGETREGLRLMVI